MRNCEKTFNILIFMNTVSKFKDKQAIDKSDEIFSPTEPCTLEHH